jgi:carbon storage regulator CsrA
MLVLSRKLNEKILLPGTKTAIQIVAIKSGVVRLGIEAPPEVVVLREEVPDRRTEWAAPTAPAPAEAAPARPAALTATRLRNAREDLALLRRQLQAGLLQEAETTLDKLDVEIGQMRVKVEKEPDPATPPRSVPRKTR